MGYEKVTDFQDKDAPQTDWEPYLDNGKKNTVQIVTLHTVIELPFYMVNEEGEIYSFVGKGIPQDNAKLLRTGMKILIYYDAKEENKDIIKLDRVLVAD
jgi:hypothetical protein